MAKVAFPWSIMYNLYVLLYSNTIEQTIIKRIKFVIKVVMRRFDVRNNKCVKGTLLDGLVLLFFMTFV